MNEYSKQILNTVEDEELKAACIYLDHCGYLDKIPDILDLIGNDWSDATRHSSGSIIRILASTSSDKRDAVANNWKTFWKEHPEIHY